MSEQEEQKTTPKSPIAAREEEILEVWKDKRIFEKTLEKKSPEGEFVFYEGPPTANGRPGIHHLEARAFKDIIPRYKTMRGFHVRRKGGWDTHGLPVELEVEKQLGFKGKKDIEEYGIAAFNERCKVSVWKYVDEWENFTERIGYWVDLKDPYITYKSEYIESVWNIFKTVHDKDLVYKDYKVVPWCPRCGTALSSHELAQGYETVKDLSVYVKFKATDADEYFLAWTTTPWTLPGNVALAVGNKIDYVKVKVENDTLWVAENRLDKVAPGAIVIEKVKGKELVGRSYEALYPFLTNNLPDTEKSKLSHAFKIYAADFVTTEDGTGIVHTAVMYGQDDFALGTEHKLPKFHLVGTDGKFISHTDFLAGKFVKAEETEIDIIKDLAHSGKLFKKEKYEHTYPFCWRCKTPLIYYARDSWYIRMSDLRDKLVRENEGIHWEPDYIKEGRFGEWLKDVKDWAISRERYWGTPLPIWQSEDGLVREAIGSIEELKEKTKGTNNYFVMRHGIADNNVAMTMSGSHTAPSHLTEEGKKQVEKAAGKLAKEKIDLIISSDFVRTRETAEVVAETIGLDKTSILFDARLREFNFGDYDGKTLVEWHTYWQTRMHGDQLTHVPGGESPDDVRKRIADFLYDIHSKYEGKNILVISHQDPIWYMNLVAEGKCVDDMAQDEWGAFVFKNAEVRPLGFAPLPHNENFELDLHKPYIDSVTWKTKDGKVMKRVSEVMDVWFDSGAMPFAQDHYPFENKKELNKSGFPADYISEAIDQTRGWFYTLHAIGTLMGKGKAYKNVICLGHILDKDGQKMSKSRGNAVSPWEMIEKYGVDALRFWMYSVNQPGESKNFDEKTVDEVIKKVFNLLLNSVKFYEMYGEEGKTVVLPTNGAPKSSHPLDQWIIALLHKLTAETADSLDGYKVLEPARAIRDFIADLSQWYIRVSRERFRGEDAADRAQALSTTKYILRELSKIIAPFMPFLAEDIYLRVTGGTEKESVHLETWPIYHKPDEKILKSMVEIRNVVSQGLEARARAAVKVRQPLASVTIKAAKGTYADPLLELVRDELNVKETVLDPKIAADVLLDTNITPALKKEGTARDLIRYIQDMRKAAGMSPKDSITLSIATDDVGKEIVTEYRDEIQKVTGARELKLEHIENGAGLKLDNMSFTFAIKR